MENYYFILWLLMTACSCVLLYIIKQKNAIIKKYNELLSDKDGKIKDVEALKKSIESSEELIKSQEDFLKMTNKRIDDYDKDNRMLRKISAEFTPMKTMGDYTDKVTKFSEQAEDMFGVYIDEIILKRQNIMFCRYWDVEVKTKGKDKPAEEKVVKAEPH